MKELLQEFGFVDGEVSVYLFLLENRDIPAYKVAKGTTIPRTTVYKILEDLKARGFVSSWIKNGVRHFSAESPELLKRSLKRKEELIQEILPEMLSVFKSDTVHPSAKLYEGKDGVVQVFENILDIINRKKLKRLYVYSDYHLTEQFPKYFRDWRLRKNKTEAFTQLIVPYGTPVNENYTSNSFRETRVMSKKFPIDGSVDICGSHVAFFSFKNNEVYAITIDSPIIAEMLTQFFLYIWDTLDGSNLQ